jgi:predicted GNAT superfamily acetyltransferase
MMTGDIVGPDDRAVKAADNAADAAALAGRVTIRELADIAALRSVERLYDEIWHPDQAAPINTELLRAFAKAGNYVVGAFDADELVGACVGFFSAPARATLHSHIAGVAPRALGRSVGYALKLHQRAWALQRGVTSIEWTFDPLVRRNAYFNLVKLGARAVEYLPNFYGGLRDAINADDETDRLLVRWHLLASEAVTPRRGEGDPAVVALDATTDGAPLLGRLDAGVSLVGVPRDIEAMRVQDHERAKQWRTAMRTALGGLMDSGARVTGFDRAGWYVVERGVRA